MKIIFVCLGNICRSPMAEAMFRQMVAQEKLSDQIKLTLRRPVMKKKAILLILAHKKRCVAIT